MKVSTYLTQAEMKLMNKAELPDHMARIRDRFLIACNTGMRFSDFCRFNIGNIQNGLVVYTPKKTSREGKATKQIVVPASAMVIEIMRRNKNLLPPSTAYRNYIHYLPEIARLSGIDTKIRVDEKIDGQMVTREIPKHRFITTHTGRRTFCTNLALYGNISMSKMLLLSGHETETSFRKYVRIGATENARDLAGHDFFKRK